LQLAAWVNLKEGTEIMLLPQAQLMEQAEQDSIPIGKIRIYLAGDLGLAGKLHMAALAVEPVRMMGLAVQDRTMIYMLPRQTHL
jgi:hypothetical protein